MPWSGPDNRIPHYPDTTDYEPQPTEGVAPSGPPADEHATDPATPTAGLPPVSEQPRKLLTGWREIAAALDMKYAESDKIKSANERFKGPVVNSGKGTSPMVYRDDLYTDLPQSTIDKWYRHEQKQEDGTIRRYNMGDTSGPGGAKKGNPYYEWNGITRFWRFSRETMQELHDANKLAYT
jgi:hypothetical protein